METCRMPGEDADFFKTASLVRAAQGGDSDAMEALFARYLPRVRQMVRPRLRRSTPQYDDLDDIIQEALLKVFRGLEKFEHRSEEAFVKWTSRLVEHAIIDHMREARRRRDVRLDTLLEMILRGKSPRPSQIVRARELKERLEEALLQLPEHQREIIELRVDRELSYEEIAEIMGFEKDATARQAFSRALKRLKERLPEYFAQ
jgi:RNA polymerase sigma-70 factor (ECF subfamily)